VPTVDYVHPLHFNECGASDAHFQTALIPHTSDQRRVIGLDPALGIYREFLSRLQQFLGFSVGNAAGAVVFGDIAFVAATIEVR
jgi:hypothetical protein